MDARLPNISIQRVLVLLVNYFFGYLFLYPKLLAIITLRMDPTATMIPTGLQCLAYAVTFLITVWASYPVLVDGYRMFKQHGKENLQTMSKHIVCILAINLILSLLVSLLTDTVTSVNQEEIVQSSYIQPFFNMLITLCFAPVVEECVFRGGIFLKVRERFGFLVSALISGACFGMLHVMSSLSVGNYADFMYIIVYAGIGIVLSLTYEKTKSIVSCIGVHAIANGIALLLIYI